MHVDDGLEDIRWIRGLRGERLPAASYALLPNPKKGHSFLPSERDQKMLSPVFYTAAPKCVCIRRLSGARHLSPVVLWTLWPDGGSEPLTSAPRSDFMARSLVLSIDVCRGLGISSLRANIWPNFSQADMGPRSAQECSGFLKSLKLFFPRIVLIASGTEIFWRVSLKF